MRKRTLDRIEIFKDVRVIELEVVHDADLRLVMDEFAALVEKCGVVFVAFNDEPWTVREPCALAQVVRDSANEIARVQTVVLENPREQRRRGGFAMRARDDDRTFAADEKFLEQFGQ